MTTDERVDALERENARLTETLAMLARTIGEAVDQLNRTTVIASYAKEHLMAYESLVPQIRRIKQSLDAKASRQAKQAGSLGLVPASDDAAGEMPVIDLVVPDYPQEPR